MKKSKGITLIALVITIIILLILAGVTLNIVFNGGIIEKSQTAVNTYSEEQAKEKLILDITEFKMGKITGEYSDFENYINEIKKGTLTEKDGKYKIKIYGYEFNVDAKTLEIEVGDQIPSISEKTESITAESISFVPENSEWKVDNVKDALDELYSMVGGE